MSLPRLPLPLPLRDGNRPDKFPHLSLRLPAIVQVLRGCFWPILDSALRTLFDERNITGTATSKKGVGTYPVDFHHVAAAAAAAAAAAGSFPGVYIALDCVRRTRTLRTNK